MKFKRSDKHKKKKLKGGWRRPKGLHNKIRLQKKGYGKKVKTGYKRRSEEIVLVNKKEQLATKPKSIIIAKVSRKNKEEIINEAKKLGINIINLNIERFNKKTEEKNLLKQEKQKKVTERKSKKKTIEKKVEKEEKTDEEKKKENKEEKDKVLTKK
jgi:large subunit ribosomal protein L32e